MNKPLNVCASCYFYKPISADHLCPKGTCYLELDKPEIVERNYSCGNWKEEGEGRILQ